MVKVATSLDLPIKILWPRSLSFAADQGYSMLGLGDIVVPGMFVATALRYDLNCSAHKDPKQRFSKPYFTSAMIAYIAGLATTMAVMITFRAAQPALLYLRSVNRKRVHLSFSDLIFRIAHPVSSRSLSRPYPEGS